MIITFWGIRGSIPVPDSRMVKYGGNTTCVEVNLGSEILIIDAGTGIRKLGEALIKRKINKINLFITHSHWDHIQGFPFFNPVYRKGLKLNIFACKRSCKRLERILSNQMSQEYFPITFDELKSDIKFVETPKCAMKLSGHKLSFMQTNHPTLTNAIRIEKNNKSFVFITDNELGSSSITTTREEFVNFCRGATYLIHDAQFTDKEYPHRRNWGHSTYEQALALAVEAKVKNLGLVHHDPNRIDTQLDALEKKFKPQAKRSGINLFVVQEDTTIKI